MRPSWLVAGTLLLTSCGGSETSPDPIGDTPCVGGVVLDGTCVTVGVPADGCALGFSWADGGCYAILPEANCSPGQTALPGDTACRPVLPCDGWSGVELDGTTQYVDAAYGGTDSDGSSNRPWAMIQQGIDAASPGAVVAIGAGTYVEEVEIAGKAVHLLGTCPDEVTLAGIATAYAALFIRPGAHGTQIRGLAITGATRGIALSGSSDVTIGHVRVHDTADRAIDIEDAFGPVGVVIHDSLVENVIDMAVFISGACNVLLDRVEIRDSVTDGAGFGGHGVEMYADPQTLGRPTLTVLGSRFERNQQVGVYAGSADLVIEATLFRNMVPSNSGTFGRAVIAGIEPVVGTRSVATLRGVVVEGGSDAGIFAAGSDLDIDTTTVRDVAPQPSDNNFGRGISVRDDPGSGQRATLNVRRSLIERTHEVALAVEGSDGIAEGLWIRDSLPNDGHFGRGINVQVSPETAAPCTMTVLTTLVERSAEAGVLSVDSQLTLDGIHVNQDGITSTLGGSGDGIDILFGTATLSRSRIETSPRAGIGLFTGTINIATSFLDCNAIHLDGELDYVLNDQGGNRCGCGDVDEPCKVLSSSLEPPEPL